MIDADALASSTLTPNDTVQPERIQDQITRSTHDVALLKPNQRIYALDGKGARPKNVMPQQMFASF